MNESEEKSHDSASRDQWFRADRPPVAQGLIERTPEVEVVAVNDLVDAEMNALLFKHDSTYGAYPGAVDIPMMR